MLLLLFVVVVGHWARESWLAIAWWWWHEGWKEVQLLYTHNVVSAHVAIDLHTWCFAQNACDLAILRQKGRRVHDITTFSFPALPSPLPLTPSNTLTKCSLE